MKSTIDTQNKKSFKTNYKPVKLNKHLVKKLRIMFNSMDESVYDEMEKAIENKLIAAGNAQEDISKISREIIEITNLYNALEELEKAITSNK